MTVVASTVCEICAVACRTEPYELTNLLLDICILCLPIQRIRKLQLPARQKFILSGIFFLGGL